jgi:hypothetical protein
MACTDPQKMVEFLRRKYSIRKFGLFAVACCRKITPLMLKSKLGYRAVVIAEKLADGLPITENLDEFRQRLCLEDYNFERIDRHSVTKEDGVIHSAGGAAYHALQDEESFLGGGVQDVEGPSVFQVAYRVARAAAHWQRRTSRDEITPSMFRRELMEIVPMVHEVFGNPFRPLPHLPAAVVAWNDSTARRIAQAIYDERAFDRLPILADALEEAGSTDADLFNHCRQPGEHVRGCWVVDLLLGKN